MNRDKLIAVYPTPPEVQARIMKQAAMPVRGLGDVIAAATKAVGIKPCGGCQKRQEKLNRLVPFSRQLTPAQSTKGSPDGLR